MKFFRKAAPGLVALAVLLCCVPASASPALDTPDTDASEAGEVLTDAFPAPPAPDDSILAVPDTVPDTDSGDTDTDPAPAVTMPDIGSGAVASDVSGYPSVVECSGADVTITLDDRAYTSVTDVTGSDSPSAFSDTSADAPTLPALLRSLFGEYTPRTQTVTTYFDGQPLSVSTEYVPGVAGMDMEWLSSVILFGIVLYCLFRLVGGVLK